MSGEFTAVGKMTLHIPTTRSKHIPVAIELYRAEYMFCAICLFKLYYIYQRKTRNRPIVLESALIWSIDSEWNWYGQHVAMKEKLHDSIYSDVNNSTLQKLTGSKRNSFSEGKYLLPSSLAAEKTSHKSSSPMQHHVPPTTVFHSYLVLPITTNICPTWDWRPISHLPQHIITVFQGGTYTWHSLHRQTRELSH